MSLVDDIKPYLVKNTIVGLHPNYDAYEDNPHLFTCTYFALLNKLNLQDYETDKNYLEWIHGCQIEPGLFNRRPNFPERLVSHDEYIGLCSFSDFIANSICKYGKIHYWSFNNQNPGKFTFRSWHWRMFIAVPYYKFRAGLKLNIVDKLFWSIAAIKTTFSEKGNTSGRCLIWLQSLDMRKSNSWLIKLGNWWFLKDIKSKYGDISGVYEIYFGKNHPFTTHSKNII